VLPTTESVDLQARCHNQHYRALHSWIGPPHGSSPATQSTQRSVVAPALRGTIARPPGNLICEYRLVNPGDPNKVAVDVYGYCSSASLQRATFGSTSAGWGKGDRSRDRCGT
jgi:hypothetical protein